MFNVFFFLMILAELVAASSQMLLKKSAGKEYPSFIREYLNILVMSGYGLLVVSMVITIFCYGGLGYMGTVVMEPINYILVMVMSRTFFQEKFTTKKIIGVLFIIAGIGVFYGIG